MKYAGVIVDISLQKLDRQFQYAIPERLSDRIEAGCRVKIPFGRMYRTGYVVELTDKPDIEPEKIKEILDLCEDSMTIDGKMIKLACWMKDTYGSTMNQALSVVLPVRKKIKNAEKKTVRLIIDSSEALELARSYKEKHNTAQARLLTALAQNPVSDMSELLENTGTTADAVKRLEKKRLAEIETASVFRNAYTGKTINDPIPELNDAQKRISESILADIDRGDNTPCLIKGVTGSGKTEIYMELISRTLEKGREAICLIPEIALTFQTIMRFYSRFGDCVSVINSRLSDGEKYDTYERVKEGKIKIIIGPRTALFTPFKNTGLIIIDEEHENAYKSENAPRYHARETAIKIAEMNNAKVVMGSATPSLDSYYKACHGIYRLYRIDERAGKGTLPDVETVDLREEMKKGNRSVFSFRLQELMKEKLEAGEQIMLFLNRRGYQGFINCRDCGSTIECPHCAVSLTEHRGMKLICHYCGYETDMYKKCPSCGSVHIGRFKAGTEKIEEEAGKLFPGARILRMDSDTTKGKKGHESILKRFQEHEADILIGTQMIVKGHDFPDVTLVGILLADTTLHSSDYLASERTFELLTQAAGRAGRGSKAGKVVIQTYSPEHYCIKCAGEQNYDRFYDEEIAYRELMNYPPVMHMLNIRISSADEGICETAAECLKNETITKESDSLYVVGPAKAAVYKINDIFYRTIYYKHQDYAVLTEIRGIAEKYIKKSDIFSGCQIQYDFR